MIPIYTSAKCLGDLPLVGSMQCSTLPTKEERGRLQAGGYMRPTERDGCHTCAQAALCSRESSWRCLLLVSEVEPFGRCPQWTRGRPRPQGRAEA